VTVSGEAEWPEVADAVIEAENSTTKPRRVWKKLEAHAAELTQQHTRVKALVIDIALHCV
jgi:hypothetical protein